MLNSERDFQGMIQSVLLGEQEVDDFSEEMAIGEISDFESAGVMTMNAGLVVRLANGNEFQVTIVQSVFATDDDEDGGF